MKIIELNNKIAMRHNQLGWAHTSKEEKKRLIENQLKDFENLEKEIIKLKKEYGNDI